MWILAIETSCDDTSVSILYNDKVKSNIISSQIEIHKNFGGIVPELASREHLKNIDIVLDLALKKAKISIKKIEYIAYTSEPGLSGSLKIGRLIAQTLSDYLEIPIIKINHLEGHVYSAAIGNEFIFPLISLLVSGGHTLLFYMKKHLDFKVIGYSLDDAVGECFDKVGRMLKLDYPAGPIIDKLAQKGKSNFYNFPSIMFNDSLNFSFSGLKTFCFNLIKKLGKKINLNNFCTSFQENCIDQLIRKTKSAIVKFNPKMIVLAGGVSANNGLRKSINLLKNKNLSILVPDINYCTDNAAMIGRLAYQKIINN